MSFALSRRAESDIRDIYFSSVWTRWLRVRCFDSGKVLSRPAPEGAAQLGETHSAPISFSSHVASAGSVSSTARCILGHCRGSRLELLRRISRSIQQFRRTTREAELHYGSDSRCALLRSPRTLSICNVSQCKHFQGSSRAEGRSVFAGSLSAEFDAAYGPCTIAHQDVTKLPQPYFGSRGSCDGAACVEFHSAAQVNYCTSSRKPRTSRLGLTLRLRIPAGANCSS